MSESKGEQNPEMVGPFLCGLCGGEGFIPDEVVRNAVRTCPSCNGSGEVYK